MSDIKQRTTNYINEVAQYTNELQKELDYPVKLLCALLAELKEAGKALDNDESKIIRNAKDGFPEGREDRVLTLTERVQSLCTYASDWKRWCLECEHIVDTLTKKLKALEKYFEPTGEVLKHTRSCDALDPGEECTCGLTYRQQTQTAETVRAGWMKRAEEAEQTLTVLTAERDRLQRLFHSEEGHSKLLREELCHSKQEGRREAAEETKQIAVKFFYWWHNQPGTNTEQGYDEFAAKYLKGEG